MIDGLTVAGLSDTGAQLKHHCNPAQYLQRRPQRAPDRGEYRQAAGDVSLDQFARLHKEMYSNKRHISHPCAIYMSR
jgi:hypothetical protein